MADDALSIEGVRLSSPDKVLWPDQGVTKRELAEYYLAVADWIVPEIKDRPLTLLRCPQGQESHCFVQRRASDEHPPYLRRVKVELEGEEAAEHLAVSSIRGVIFLVQIGVLEIHAWGARRDRLDRPDRLVFDLDPDPSVPFTRVVDAALQLRARLAGLSLESFVKTTGGKGLHVVVPLIRSADWPEAKQFCRAIAEEMESREPERFVAEASKAKRVGRIYVDYLRNGYGATAVASYSSRAKAGATVSTPITWAELEKGLDPSSFTIRTVPSRLRSLRNDPWDAYEESRRRLTAKILSAV